MTQKLLDYGRRLDKPWVTIEASNMNETLLYELVNRLSDATKVVERDNGAQLRMLLSGVPAAAFVEAGYERIALLFDGRDEEALAEARREWTGLKAAGVAPSYWRESDDGGWARAR